MQTFADMPRRFLTLTDIWLHILHMANNFVVELVSQFSCVWIQHDFLWCRRFIWPLQTQEDVFQQTKMSAHAQDTFWHQQNGCMHSSSRHWLTSTTMSQTCIVLDWWNQIFLAMTLHLKGADLMPLLATLPLMLKWEEWSVLSSLCSHAGLQWTSISQQWNVWELHPMFLHCGQDGWCQLCFTNLWFCCETG